MLPPKNVAEKRLTGLLAIPMVALMIGGPLVSVLLVESFSGRGLSFLDAWLHAYLVWQVVNLWDLVVVDIVGFALLDPDNPPIPGTAGAAGYRDFGFHAIGFVKGTVMGVVLAAAPAGLAMVV